MGSEMCIRDRNNAFLPLIISSTDNSEYAGGEIKLNAAIKKIYLIKFMLYFEDI